MGTHDGTHVGAGAGIGLTAMSPGLGIGLYGGKTQTQSKLANELAPPKQPDLPDPAQPLGCLCFLAILFLLAFFVKMPSDVRITCLIVLAIIFAIAKWYLRQCTLAHNAHKKQMEDWEATWYCLRCGHKWTP